MWKITAPDFTLSQVLAMQKHKTLEGGANKPLVIKGIDTVKHKSGDYVLKYRGAEGMYEQTSCFELLGAFIAAQIEIATPEPVIIVVDDLFLETLRGQSEYANVAKGKGINYGSSYVRIKADVIKKQDLTLAQQQQAARIFAFDLMIKNADRNDRKPNMFLANDDIFVYDHEKAFGFFFTLSLFLSPNPWELNDTDVNDAKNHFFYPSLHGNKRIDWDEAFATFTNLDEEFWLKAMQLLPPTWNDPADTFVRIEKHVNSIIHQLTIFKTEIWTKLINS